MKSECIEGCAVGFDTILPMVESLSLTNEKKKNEKRKNV
jgi:hypothetical protein